MFCGSHVRVALNHVHVRANVLQCTVEFMHVVVALLGLPWGNAGHMSGWRRKGSCNMLLNALARQRVP